MPLLMQIDAQFMKERRAALSRHPLLGIDYVATRSTDRSLVVHFVPSAPSLSKEDVGKKEEIVRSITPDNFRITGAFETRIRIEAVSALADDPLAISVRYDAGAAQEIDDSQRYTLEIVDVPDVDPVFARITFVLDVDRPADVDPRPAPSSLAGPPPDPEINYLARDYSSFRRLMFDRLSVLRPQSTGRHAADLEVALVEVLAYAADHLSYYQDAVATEAYLGTARRRVSVRRHARLVDYTMHDGCNSRAWVHIKVDGDIRLGRGTQFFTRLAGQEARISPSSPAYAQALAQRPDVFETMHDARLYEAHNAIPFYTWGAEARALPQGATRATLRDAWLDKDQSQRALAALQPGDVLIFEEVRDPDATINSNPARRHAVRLTGVVPSIDPVGDNLHDEDGGGTPLGTAVPIVEIEWATEDALLVPLQLSTRIGNDRPIRIGMARGNIVLSDHGRTMPGETLPSVPDAGRYRPQLQFGNLTVTVSNVDMLAERPAAAAIDQDPRVAMPAVTLFEPAEAQPHLATTWTPQRDLLNSEPFDRDFVVEMENDGRATVRFGDGVRGRRPPAGTALMARYRIGNGPRGNIGPESIGHVITDDTHIVGARNPLAAQGGTSPEPIEQVRMFAPWAFRSQERCISAADYQAMAERHPQVRRAAAVLRWEGSLSTAFVAVVRADSQPVDAAFATDVRAFLERFRPIGSDVEIRPPRFVPLEIVMTVYVASEAFRSAVRQALRETFGRDDLPAGQRGFFHPDNFSFGQPVYVSQVLAAAMRISGVSRVEIERFRRWERPALGELEAGQILIAPLEIARLDNDASAPHNGTIEFTIVGGR